MTDYNVNGGKPYVDLRTYGSDVIAVLIENAPEFTRLRPGGGNSRYLAVEMDVERAKRLRDNLTFRIEAIERG